MNYFQKIWNFLSIFKEYFLLVYVIFALKIIIVQPTFQTAANLLVLGSVYSFIYWLNNKNKSNIEEEFKEGITKELEELKSKVIRVNLEIQQSKRK
jgi:hypothetical protein